jgi:hypothetical protein
LADVGLSESTEEERAAAIAAIAELENIEADSLAKRRELKEKENELNNKERAAIDKKAANDKKRRTDELKAEQVAREDALKWEAEIQAQVDATAKQYQDDLINKLNDVNAARKQNYEDQLTDLDIMIEEEAIQIDDAYANRLISEEEHQEQMLQLEVNRLQQQAELVKAYYGEGSREAEKAVIDLNSFITQMRVKDTQQLVRLLFM